MHLDGIEYRTIACEDRAEAQNLETEMRRKDGYRFRT